MPKARILILICLVLVILGYAVFLSVDTESGIGKSIYSNALIPALLFFVFFGAMAGIMKILVDRALPNRMPSNAEKGWGMTRSKGKLGYVLNALLLTGLPLLLMLGLQFASSKDSPDGVRNLVVLSIVFMGGIAAIAASLWSYQESIYLKAKDQEEASSADKEKLRDESRLH